MTKLVPKKDRALETINATVEDVKKLYQAIILYNLSNHFRKKVFGKEDAFRKEAHKLYRETVESINCDYSFNDRDNGQIDGTLYSIDDVEVYLRHIMPRLHEATGNSANDRVNDLCYKFDKGREFKIIPVLEKLIKDYRIHRN
jgi:hypothetical protein